MKFILKTAVALSLIVMSACVPKPSGDTKKPVETGKDPDGEPKETVDIPNNISGSYLVCALRKEPTEEELQQEFGCLLQDTQSGKKVSLDERVSWSSNLSESVQVEVQTPASVYHVLYKVGGSSVSEVRERALTLEALARFDNVIFKQEKVYNILKPAIDLEDYEAPINRVQTIKPDDDGSL